MYIAYGVGHVGVVLGQCTFQDDGDFFRAANLARPCFSVLVNFILLGVTIQFVVRPARVKGAFLVQHDGRGAVLLLVFLLQRQILGDQR